MPGRISGLHYGTYDYSASLQISAEYQSMEHPVADFAKEVMQLAVAGTGIRLSDGSTNIIPVGDNVENAWQLHGRLVRRSLERGYYQGWDLHPAQLPSRFAATYAFYRQGLPAAAARLRNYVEHTGGGVLDEPATARALAAFVLRGVQCGAVGADEVLALAGVGLPQLTGLAHPRLAATPPPDNPPDQKERTHEQLLLPRGRASAADPDPHRPGRGQGGLHGHPQGRAAGHRHEQPARLDQHPLLDPCPAHRRFCHDVLAADRRGGPGRRLRRSPSRRPASKASSS